MRIVVFDPFHGAAGDMITGALLGCGADRELVVRAMRSVVQEPGITEVTRCGIRAVKVDTHAPATHRTLAEVMARLDAASAIVPGPVLAMTRRVFERINAAEGQVHGAHVHFHEVGADDAIADVLGACTALHSLNADGVAVLPIALGHGVSTGSHGRFPLPAPATVAILQGSGLATFAGDDGELCTPTGAALLAEFSTFDPVDTGAAKILAIGYGAGTRDPPGVPNVIRATIMETITDPWMPQDCVDVLETNVDDVTGELIAHAITRFMDAGARDASAAPIIMKKGRPGYLIRVICSGECSGAMAELMARELGTLGIRCIPAVHRFIADRTLEEVEVVISGHKRKVPVKCGRIHGEVYLVKAEFDHARDWAGELGVPVRGVIETIETAARNVLKKK
jgi:pyridinium-3,5-bisthiocarboxylic acid mononucleotide nickel chelatase